MRPNQTTLAQIKPGRAMLAPVFAGCIAQPGPPSVHEARLGMPEQPSFLSARKAGHRLSPRT